MGNRRKAREYALQLLFQYELAADDFEKAEEHFWNEVPEKEEETKAFAKELVKGVVLKRKEMDALIEKYAANWKLSRMTPVDRNILRLAAYEFQELKDIPVKVTLNEAIEIGKKFGTEESGSFINGILDKIAADFKEQKEK